MAIIYPLTLPSTPGFRRMTPRAMNAVGLSISPFTYVQQVQEWSGEMLGFGCELPPMDRATAAQWEALLLALRGVSGTVLLGPPQSAPLGVGTGSPQVNPFNAGLIGKLLDTIGWTASQTNILKRGDWLQLGRNYLTFPKDFDNAAWVKSQCTVAANTQTDPTGNATADRATPDVGATLAQIHQSPTFPSGVSIAARPFRFGIYLRAASGTPSIGMYIVNQAGTIRAETVCAMTTSWQFFSVSATMNAADTGVQVYFGGGDNPWTEAKGPIDLWGASLDATDQNQRLHMNLTDQNSDSVTAAKFDLFARLHEPSEPFAPIVVANPKGLFRLRKNLREWEINQALHRGMAFEVIEAL